MIFKINSKKKYSPCRKRRITDCPALMPLMALIDVTDDDESRNESRCDVLATGRPITLIRSPINGRIAR